MYKTPPPERALRAYIAYRVARGAACSTQQTTTTTYSIQHTAHNIYTNTAYRDTYTQYIRSINDNDTCTLHLGLGYIYRVYVYRADKDSRSPQTQTASPRIRPSDRSDHLPHIGHMSTYIRKCKTYKKFAIYIYLYTRFFERHTYTYKKRLPAYSSL